jgi:hypothetical protein
MKKLVALSMIVVLLGFFSFGCAPPAAKEKAPETPPVGDTAPADVEAPADASTAAPAEEAK